MSYQSHEMTEKENQRKERYMLMKRHRQTQRQEHKHQEKQRKKKKKNSQLRSEISDNGMKTNLIQSNETKRMQQKVIKHPERCAIDENI
jgi:hypothetical protein